MNEEPENPWKQLTEAARQARPDMARDMPPPRVADIRQRVMVLVHALLWRRVSLVIALIAGLTWLAIFLLSRRDESAPPLIPPPPELFQNPLKP